MIEWIFGIATVISLGIAIWQYFESRYYQKINANNDERINQLMIENRLLLQKIDKETEQTFEHKDMNRLLPKIFEIKSGSEINKNIEKKISEGFTEVRKEIEKIKNDFKSDSKVQKKIENLDLKIKQAEEKTIRRTDDDHTIDFAFSQIYSLNDLKSHIKVFSWINAKPRKFKKETREYIKILEGRTQKYYVYRIFDMPQILSPANFTDNYESFFNINGDELTLSQLGKRFLKEMNLLLQKYNK